MTVRPMNKAQIIEKLKNKGIKVTPQRLEIVAYLEENDSHPTIETIFAAVRQKYPMVSLATVYNTLDMLVSIGEVVKLQIPPDNKVHIDYRTTFHHHFFCHNCRQVLDVDLCCDRVESLRLEGYQVDEMHGYFKGVCKDCKKSSDSGLE